jgi:flagellar protein FliS
MKKMNIASALKQYRSVGVKSGVEGASAHRLVEMLMEGALDKISVAKGMSERNDIQGRTQHINWAISIITGLWESLDAERGGEVANNLGSLYEYMIRRLVDANKENDVAVLNEVGQLMEEVRNAWSAMPEHIKNPPSRGVASSSG